MEGEAEAEEEEEEEEEGWIDNHLKMSSNNNNIQIEFDGSDNT